MSAPWQYWAYAPRWRRLAAPIVRIVPGPAHSLAQIEEDRPIGVAALIVLYWRDDDGWGLCRGRTRLCRHPVRCPARLPGTSP